jgi:hypothetical protein
MPLFFVYFHYFSAAAPFDNDVYATIILLRPRDIAMPTLMFYCPERHYAMPDAITLRASADAADARCFIFPLRRHAIRHDAHRIFRRPPTLIERRAMPR